MIGDDEEYHAIMIMDLYRISAMIGIVAINKKPAWLTKRP